MPQLPMLIPLVVTGLLVGSMLKSESHRISKKKLAGAAVLSGLLNGGQAYLVYIMTPLPTSTFFQTTAAATLRGTSEVDFTISSILAGILIVLVIVGIAMLYARSRGGAEEEESVEPTDEK
jgi:protein-S-isoprenylcysteine O-methyltransferase Ste14